VGLPTPPRCLLPVTQPSHVCAERFTLRLTLLRVPFSSSFHTSSTRFSFIRGWTRWLFPLVCRLLVLPCVTRLFWMDSTFYTTLVPAFICSFRWRWLHGALRFVPPWFVVPHLSSRIWTSLRLHVVPLITPRFPLLPLTHALVCRYPPDVHLVVVDPTRTFLRFRLVRSHATRFPLTLASWHVPPHGLFGSFPHTHCGWLLHFGWSRCPDFHTFPYARFRTFACRVRLRCCHAGLGLGSTSPTAVPHPSRLCRYRFPTPPPVRLPFYLPR